MFRRKRFLINPKVQLAIIGFNFALATLAIVVFYAENIYLFAKFTEMESPEFLTDPIIAQMIADEQFRMKIVFAGTAAVVLGMIVIGGLVLSNRVVGPIYRLERHLKELLEGKAQAGSLSFRKKDFFHELADLMNKALKR